MLRLYRFLHNAGARRRICLVWGRDCGLASHGMVVSNVKREEVQERVVKECDAKSVKGCNSNAVEALASFYGGDAGRHPASISSSSPVGRNKERAPLSPTSLAKLDQLISQINDGESPDALRRGLASHPKLAPQWERLLESACDTKELAGDVVRMMVERITCDGDTDPELIRQALVLCSSDVSLCDMVWKWSVPVRAAASSDSMELLHKHYLKSCHSDLRRLSAAWDEARTFSSVGTLSPGLYLEFARLFCANGEAQQVSEVAKTVLESMVDTDRDFWFAMLHTNKDFDVACVPREGSQSAAHLASAACCLALERTAHGQLKFFRHYSDQAEKCLRVMLSAPICLPAGFNAAMLGMEYCYQAGNVELGTKLWNWTLCALDNKPAGVCDHFVGLYAQLCAKGGNPQRLSELWEDIAPRLFSMKLVSQTYGTVASALCLVGEFRKVEDVVAAMENNGVSIHEQFWRHLLNSCMDLEAAKFILHKLLENTTLVTQVNAYFEVMRIAVAAGLRSEVDKLQEQQTALCAKVLGLRVCDPETDMRLVDLMLKCCLRQHNTDLVRRLWSWCEPLRSASAASSSLVPIFRMFLELCDTTQLADLYKEVFDEVWRLSLLGYFCTDEASRSSLVVELCNNGLPGRALDVVQASSAYGMVDVGVLWYILKFCRLPADVGVVERLANMSKLLVGWTEEKLLLFDALESSLECSALNQSVQAEIFNLCSELSKLDGAMKSMPAAKVALKWSSKLDDTLLAGRLQMRAKPVVLMAEVNGSAQWARELQDFATDCVATGHTLLLSSAWSSIFSALEANKKHSIIWTLARAGLFTETLTLLHNTPGQPLNFLSVSLSGLLKVCYESKNLPMAEACHNWLMQLPLLPNEQIVSFYMFSKVCFVCGELGRMRGALDIICSHLCMRMFDQENPAEVSWIAVMACMASLFQSESSDVGVAMAIWNWCRPLWMKPSRRTYKVACWGILLCAKDRPDLALQVWRDVNSVLFPHRDIVLSVLVFSLAPLQCQEAASFFAEFGRHIDEKEQLKALVAVYAHRNEWQQVSSLLDTHMKSGASDMVTACHQANVTALCYRGQCAEALKVIDRAKSDGISLPWSTLLCVARSAAYHGRAPELLQSLSVLKQLSYSGIALSPLFARECLRALYDRAENDDVLEKQFGNCQDASKRHTTVHGLPFTFPDVSLPEQIRERRLDVLAKIMHWQIALSVDKATEGSANCLLRLNSETLAVAYAILCGKRHIQLSTTRPISTSSHRVLRFVTLVECVTITYQCAHSEHWMNLGACSCGSQ